MVLALAAILGVAISGGAEGSASPVSVAAAEPEQPAVVHTLDVEGTPRTYRVYAPAGSTGVLPLVVVLHGRGQSPQTVASQTGFIALADAKQAVVVYADGINRSWNAGHGCCGAAGEKGEPDAAFVAAVVADAERSLPVDPARVYLVGYSNGGKLAYAVSCAHPQLFAAMATYGSVPLEACPKAAPVPTMIAYGGADTVVPPEGMPAAHPPLPAIGTALGWLLTRNGCSGTPPSTAVGPALVQRWNRCTRADVESVDYPQLGHPWPASAIVGSLASGETLMWTFLSRHHR